MPGKTDYQQYWGCPCCDLLVKKQVLDYTQKAQCPRCHVVLSQPQKDSAQKTLALSIAALILFFPAVYLPLMSLNLLGYTQPQSIMQSIQVLFGEQYYFIAMIILITCVVIPLMKILILGYISLSVFQNHYLPHAIALFRLYHGIEEWGMLEIYMLGILVSIIKLEGLADLQFDLGLILFILLLIMVVLSSSFLDEEYFWDQLGRLHP